MRKIRYVLVAAVTVSAAVACSATGPAPEPAPPAIPGLLWVGDFESGDLSQYEDTPWNVAGGAPVPRLVSDPALVRNGQYAVEITIPGVTTGEGLCCDPRSEIEPSTPDFVEGDDVYFAFSTLLAEGFPISEEWQVITQWKQNFDGSPPLSVVVRDGGFYLSGGGDSPDGPEDGFEEYLGEAVIGEWIDWTVHITFSTDPTVGLVEIWSGDDLVLPAYRPASATMYRNPEGDAPASTIKTGYYRNGDIAAPGTLYYDEWRIAATRDALRKL